MSETTDTKKKHLVKLPNLSAKVLADLIQSTGWTRNTSDIVVSAGIINRDAIPEKVPESLYKTQPNGDKTLSEPDLRGWGDTVIELELSEKERDVCKFVIEHFSKSSKIPPTKYAYKLLVEFGFGDS